MWWRTAVLVGMLGLGAGSAAAHTLNPAVIESLTGETIEYDDHHHAADEAVADPRDESRTFYSFPEWYIVYSAQEYADFVASGNRPSQFPYFAAIGQMWDAWEFSEAAAGAPPDATTNTVLWTIAVSFTIEYGLIGIYENTIGRLSEWLHLGYKSTEDVYTDEVAMEYGQFLNQIPWYSFPYGQKLGGLWTTYSWSSLSPRGLERRTAYTIGYGAKAVYAGAIRLASESTFEGGAGQTTTVTLSATEESIIGTLGHDYVVGSSTDEYIISLPRYRAFKEPFETLLAQPVEVQAIQGHTKITLSLVAETASPCPTLSQYTTARMSLVTDQATSRYVLSVPVSELQQVYTQLQPCDIAAEHIYDY